MMCADWMQGPYVYELYEYYNFPKATIGHLFVVGFGASAIFGPFVGLFSDMFGRKRMCLIFGVCYGLCCITKHSPDLAILYFGRFLGGISTSILFSAFEAWMVTHHNANSYPPELLGDTFSWAWGWNGGVAVFAGVVTNIAADRYGPVAAF
eukprot:UN33964